MWRSHVTKCAQANRRHASPPGAWRQFARTFRAQSQSREALSRLERSASIDSANSNFSYAQHFMKHMILFLCILSLAPLLAGCSTGSGIVTVGKDSYTVVKSGTTGFTPLGVLKSRAYKEANAFAQKKAKVMEVISVNEIPAGFAKWPQVEVKFRLLDPDAIARDETRRVQETVTVNSYDAEGRRTDSKQQLREIVPAGSKLDLPPEGDLYVELKHLDELRKSGLLTEEEFQTQKKRLLDRRK